MMDVVLQSAVNEGAFALVLILSMIGMFVYVLFFQDLPNQHDIEMERIRREAEKQALRDELGLDQNPQRKRRVRPTAPVKPTTGTDTEPEPETQPETNPEVGTGLDTKVDRVSKSTEVDIPDPSFTDAEPRKSTTASDPPPSLEDLPETDELPDPDEI